MGCFNRRWNRSSHGNHACCIIGCSTENSKQRQRNSSVNRFGGCFGLQTKFESCGCRFSTAQYSQQVSGCANVEASNAIISNFELRRWPSSGERLLDVRCCSISSGTAGGEIAGRRDGACVCGSLQLPAACAAT